jgi:hypothetical protein
MICKAKAHRFNFYSTGSIKLWLLLISSILFINSAKLNAQQKNNLIQFSGMVLEADSLFPIPFAHVIIQNSNRGTVSDYYGFFSFVAQKNDTIEFSSVGYKKAYFVIPDTISSNRYSLIQVLKNDTIQLREVLIYPWPSKEEFRNAFMNLNVADDDVIRASKNLELAQMKQQLSAMPIDGSSSYKYQMQQIQSKLYYAGQAPPINLMNPIAWSNFIKAWKAGELKIKNQ